MSYLRNLRVQLQERRNRLYRCSSRTYEAELGYLLQFLDDNCYTKNLLETLNAGDSADFQSWCENTHSYEPADFPATEEGRAKICYGIVNQCANSQGGAAWEHWMWIFSSEQSLDDRLRDLTEAVVDPLINYLHDRIDDAGNVLYLLERFKGKVEWFRRKELFQIYKENTSVGEANLDLALRAALFDGGIEYPFSEPSSPSGKADVVALLGSDDPLVLEVKVYDPETGKNIRHLQQGFNQIVRYADNYNESLGYLVIFNCSERQLVISPDESEDPDFPPRISYSGKTFFTIVIDVHPVVASASVEKPSNRVVVSTEQLTGAP